MSSEQEAALRVAKELLKVALRQVETQFRISGADDVCLPIVKAVDSINDRLRVGAYSAMAAAQEKR